MTQFRYGIIDVFVCFFLFFDYFDGSVKQEAAARNQLNQFGEYIFLHSNHFLVNCVLEEIAAVGYTF